MIYTNFMNGLINGYFHLTLTNVIIIIIFI